MKSLLLLEDDITYCSVLSRILEKIFCRKFVHSIYTYIIYSSCLNVLK